MVIFQFANCKRLPEAKIYGESKPWLINGCEFNKKVPSGNFLQSAIENESFSSLIYRHYPLVN